MNLLLVLFVSIVSIVVGLFLIVIVSFAVLYWLFQKMECFSEKFKTVATLALDSQNITIGTIALDGSNFILRVKQRQDIEVGEQNRDILPNVILERIFNKS